MQDFNSFIEKLIKIKNKYSQPVKNYIDKLLINYGITSQ